MLRSRSLALIALAALAACSKNSESTPGPAPSASAPPPAPPPSVAVWRLSIDAGKAHVDMPAAKLHSLGDATAAKGSFEVTPTDLGATRGALLVDLTTLAMHTFGNADDDKQTTAAQAWLEAPRKDTRDDSYRHASFAIQSVDGLSAADLTKVTPTRDGKDDVRSVTMTAHGDLLIHGHKVHRDVKVSATFRHPAGAAADSPPTRVEVTSTEPLRVDLPEIDIRPRDPVTGKVVALAAAFAGKVADHVDVTVAVTAVPVR